MKVFGLNGIVPAGQTIDFTWECPSNIDGRLNRIYIHEYTANNFVISKLRLIREDEDVEDFIYANYPVAATCLNKHLEHGIDWYVHEKDVIELGVYNATGSIQAFWSSLEIGADPLGDGRWWADEETGKLVRPILFHERTLKTGTQVGSLRIVDPVTYEGFTD